MLWHLNENAWEYIRFDRENCMKRFARFIANNQSQVSALYI